MCNENDALTPDTRPTIISGIHLTLCITSERKVTEKNSGRIRINDSDSYQSKLNDKDYQWINGLGIIAIYVFH